MELGALTLFLCVCVLLHSLLLRFHGFLLVFAFVHLHQFALGLALQDCFSVFVQLQLCDYHLLTDELNEIYLA